MYVIGRAALPALAEFVPYVVHLLLAAPNNTALANPGRHLQVVLPTIPAPDGVRLRCKVGLAT